MNKIDRNKCMKNDVSIELYGEIKYLMNEWVEESKKIINSKERLEKEVQELRKENEDLDIELGRIPHLKEQVREIKEENERLKKLEKEIESLRKKNSDLENGMDDMNENFGEIIEYEVSERMGEDYINLYGREIAVLKGDIRFLKKEKVELEDKNISLSLRVRDMERANLKNTKN